MQTLLRNPQTEDLLELSSGRCPRAHHTARPGLRAGVAELVERGHALPDRLQVGTQLREELRERREQLDLVQ